MTIKPDREIASPLKIEAVMYHLESWRDQLRQSQLKRRLHLKAPAENNQALIKELRLLHLKVDIDKVEEVEAALATIKEWYRIAPVVHLSFPVTPSIEMQAQITDWLQREISPDTLVDFRVDSAIAAGFLLRTKSRLFDFSANGRLWQNRRQLGESIKRV